MLPDQVICDKDFLGLLSANFIISEGYSLILVLLSLLYRWAYSVLVKFARFKSRKIQDLWVVYTINFVFFINYGYIYAYSPFY